MNKVKLLLIVCLLISANTKAQNIAPTNLFEVYKTWQMDDPNYYKYAYQYLMTVDKHWTVAIPPDEKNGLSLVFCYKLDSTNIYKPHEYELDWMNDKTRPIPKGILYSFTDISLWNSYNQQMEQMNATKVTEGTYEGGHQVIYKVNDIVIFLRDFPPGINGDDRVYQVQMGHESPN